MTQHIGQAPPWADVTITHEFGKPWTVTARDKERQGAPIVLTGRGAYPLLEARTTAITTLIARRQGTAPAPLAPVPQAAEAPAVVTAQPAPEPAVAIVASAPQTPAATPAAAPATKATRKRKR